MTGASPDALIFLKGETGTLCELAFALAAGRKTYLFDSATALRQALLESNLDYALGLAHSHCSSIAGKPITVKTLKQGL